MPDAKRPDPKRRAPASRPGTGKGGDGKGRPRGASAVRRDRAIEPRKAAPDAVEDVEELPEDETDDPGVIGPIKKAIAEAAEHQSEQRLGSAARRAAILAAVVCVLTLTIAGPVRTYFAQRTEMQQLATAEAQLRSQIADLEEQKVKLGDPVFIAAQARERLGFVMPGEIPYQVQLPPGAATTAAVPGVQAAPVSNGQPWYTSLWHTIADAPHGVSSTPSPAVPPVGPSPAAPPDVTPGG